MIASDRMVYLRYLIYKNEAGIDVSMPAFDCTKKP